jgi:5-aminolevulinate synthase
LPAFWPPTPAPMSPERPSMSTAEAHPSSEGHFRGKRLGLARVADNDLVHLEELLWAAVPNRPKLIVCESLYSMDGDVRRIPL